MERSQKKIMTPLNPRTQAITHINGHDFYYALAAGSQKILLHYQYMNRINVFPVPDGDTGTNLAATMKHILEEVRPKSSLKQTADSIALAALDGARGNSGIIFSQFLYGFSQWVRGNQMTVPLFSRAINKALTFAVKAIEKPVEGTIITVMRDWAHHIDNLKGRLDDFSQLIAVSLVSARKSLSETPEKLKILRLNRVVDAGAQGFVYFLEGITEFLRDRNPRKVLRSLKYRTPQLPVTENPDSAPPQFRFCTEAILEGENMSPDTLRQAIHGMGDSLVVAGGSEKLRLHIHTSNPAGVFAALQPHGRIIRQKAEDMVMQYQVVNHRKADIALVTDSVCDIPSEIVKNRQIHMIPINLHFGESSYLDKVTMTPDHFYDMAETAPKFPTTSQPSCREFENLYRFLASHYRSVIAVHLSKQLSGTWQNSRRAAEIITGETGCKISVIDSRHLSGSLGLIVHRASRAILDRVDHDNVVDLIKKWREKTHILVSVKTFEFMVRGGRVSPMKGWVANRLNLKPIISMDPEGRSVLYDKAFSQKGNIQKILKIIEKKLDGEPLWEYAMLHARNARGAEWFSERIQALTGRTPLYTVDISPVVGANAGKGAVAVALMTR